MCTRVMDRRRLIQGLAAGTVVAFAGTGSGCTTNEMLGRQQLILVTSEQMAALADGTWKRTLETEKVVRDPAYNKRLDRVAGRVVKAAGRGNETWDFAVFEDDSLNAFALPGNKIGCNSGMMEFFKDDDEMATVLGHEVGHVTARHSAERYSQQLLAQLGLTAATVALAATDTPAADEIAAVLGAGVTFGIILPFSRQHELEADSLGLQYMARAGYNPRESVGFWQRMMAEPGRSRQPEFLSTHPSDETRIANLQRQIQLMGA